MIGNGGVFVRCRVEPDLKRVFGLVIDFGASQPPKSTRPLTTYSCPSRPGHQALRNNFASSLLLRTWLPMTGRRVRRPTLFSLWRKARRENSAASRLLGSTSLRFALHGWQRLNVQDAQFRHGIPLRLHNNPCYMHYSTCPKAITSPWTTDAHRGSPAPPSSDFGFFRPELRAARNDEMLSKRGAAAGGVVQ